MPLDLNAMATIGLLLTISVRGRGLSPTTADNSGLNASAFMKAGFGTRFLAGTVDFAAVFPAVAVLTGDAFFAGAVLAEAIFFAGAFFAVAIIDSF